MDRPSEGWYKRQEIWRHNGYIGSAHMMMAQCNGILQSKTATTEAKKEAMTIYKAAERLAIALRKGRAPLKVRG